MSTEKLRKYTRAAELHVERLRIELGRLDMLLEFEFEDETVQTLMEQVKNLRSIAVETATGAA